MMSRISAGTAMSAHKILCGNTHSSQTCMNKPSAAPSLLRPARCLFQAYSVYSRLICIITCFDRSSISLPVSACIRNMPGNLIRKFPGIFVAMNIAHEPCRRQPPSMGGKSVTGLRRRGRKTINYLRPMGSSRKMRSSISLGPPSGMMGLKSIMSRTWV